MDNFLCRRVACATILAILAVLLIQPALAQTYSLLYKLNGGSDGNGTGGLVADQAGNLYGVAVAGGNQDCSYGGLNGCGTVFRLSHRGSGWIFSVLYSFTGGSDGWWPNQVVFGPDGSLYGTTSFVAGGYGTVFRLQPPPTFCPTVSCPWRITTLYTFTNFADGRYPNGPALDAAGNLYGTSNEGGNGVGNIWELSPSGNGWSYSVLYDFSVNNGSSPVHGVAIDAAGNLWGSGDGGGSCGPLGETCGLIWELARSGSGWNFQAVFGLEPTTGSAPSGVFSFDPAGNLYGTLQGNGPAGNGGVFQLVPSTGQFTLLYAVPGNPDDPFGPLGGVTIDRAGNLYGADTANGADGLGYVFKLAPSNGSWIPTDLYDFTGSPTDGSSPIGPLVVDAQGNVYGATTQGNDIFEITP